MPVNLPHGALRLPRDPAITAAPGKVSIGIRPEDLALCDETAPGRVAHGEVTLVERLGSETLAYVRTGPEASDTLIVKLGGDTDVAMGASVWLCVDPAAVHLFDADGQAIGAPA